MCYFVEKLFKSFRHILQGLDMSLLCWHGTCQCDNWVSPRFYVAYIWSNRCDHIHYSLLLNVQILWKWGMQTLSLMYQQEKVTTCQIRGSNGDLIIVNHFSCQLFQSIDLGKLVFKEACRFQCQWGGALSCWEMEFQPSCSWCIRQSLNMLK